MVWNECIEKMSMYTVYGTMYNIAHTACGSDLNQRRCLQKKRPLNTNEYDESKSSLLNNKLEFLAIEYNVYRAA